jgi:hypothetical protein
MTPDDWVIATFAGDRAVGTLTRPSAGLEVPFSLEVWWPCEPEVARSLQDSAQRRELLLPRPGEPVSVEWRRSSQGRDVPARVRRLRPLPVLPPVSFLAWLERMGEHVPALAGWGPDEWAQLLRELEEDLEDTVHAATPDNPERHLAVLAWLLTHAPPAFAARRLRWLSLTGGPGDVAVECWSDVERVFLRLSAEVVARLEAQGLVMTERTLQGG